VVFIAAGIGGFAPEVVTISRRQHRGSNSHRHRMRAPVSAPPKRIIRPDERAAVHAPRCLRHSHGLQKPGARSIRRASLTGRGERIGIRLLKPRHNGDGQSSQRLIKNIPNATLADITFDGLEISGSAEVTYAGRRLQYYHYEAGEQCLQRFLFFDKTEQPFECSSY